jgi:hypothetical protein
MLIARNSVVRTTLAAALVVAVAAGTVPLEVLSAGLGCPMPCCKGIYGAPGGCTGSTCHARLQNKKSAGHVHSDTGCGVAADAASEAHTHHASLDSAHEHHAPPETAHAHADAAPIHAADAAPLIEHGALRDVSTQNTLRETTSAAANVARPCSPDCGAVLNSFNQLRRSHNDAALAYKLRPRPPTSAATLPAPEGVVEASSQLRRLCPPRAPPTAHASPSA